MSKVHESIVMYKGKAFPVKFYFTPAFTFYRGDTNLFQANVIIDNMHDLHKWCNDNDFLVSDVLQAVKL